MEPGEGALDDPAVAAEPGAVLALAARDFGRNTPPTELAAVLVVVVAAIGGETRGTAPLSGISWVTSLRLPPVSRQASGLPVASTRGWCLEPFLARSPGLGPV